MFDAVLLEFETRLAEVDDFLALVQAVEQRSVTPIPAEFASDEIAIKSGGCDAWGPILKGASYLLLYNLVESTVRQAIAALFERIRMERIPLRRLSDAIRKEWVRQNFNRVQASDGSRTVYLESAQKLVSKVVSDALAELTDKDLPSTGNLGAKEVRHVLDRYGIEAPGNALRESGGALETVKTFRNTLSHGDQSFSNCGRERVIEDLLKERKQVEAYLRAFVESVRTFAEGRGYVVQDTSMATPV